EEELQDQSGNRQYELAVLRARVEIEEIFSVGPGEQIGENLDRPDLLPPLPFPARQDARLKSRQSRVGTRRHGQPLERGGVELSGTHENGRRLESGLGGEDGDDLPLGEVVACGRSAS